MIEVWTCLTKLHPRCLTKMCSALLSCWFHFLPPLQAFAFTSPGRTDISIFFSFSFFICRLVSISFAYVEETLLALQNSPLVLLMCVCGRLLEAYGVHILCLTLTKMAQTISTSPFVSFWSLTCIFRSTSLG